MDAPNFVYELIVTDFSCRPEGCAGEEFGDVICNIPGATTSRYLCQRPAFCTTFYTAPLIRQNIGIRQHDRIEEMRGQVSRNAVLLERTTAGERGGIVQDTDGDVIA